MKVDILGSTGLWWGTLKRAYGYDAFAHPDPVNDADAISEAGGRICYGSWDRPNPATATNEDYLSSIIAKNHTSVMEHASFTFLVRGVSRALLTELERHRHLSFSVVSQRYADHADTEAVIPPAILDAGDSDVPDLMGNPISFRDVVDSHYRLSLVINQKLYKELRARGFSVKGAREAARAVLPNATPVDLIVSGNVRAWRDVLAKRWHVAADAEIRNFAGLILDHLREHAPNSVQDIPHSPYED
ncbi:FAD-dependent thymidylate synthase [Streptomyces sp. NPDC002644]